ncbi:MAG: 50S ribosomal protein L11 methyltransferase [Rhizobiaceae bacterium]|nr:50S ribosomal protein L11 methyltransferase [Rhizobiaceae bacterium]
MTQTRLFLRSGKAVTERLFHVLDRHFEDYGYPLAQTEIDEKADVHELSLYVEADEADEVVAQMEAMEEFGGLDIGREPLPDVDWVRRSLEGLKPVRAGRFLVHGSHDRDRRRIGDIAIEIEAGLAFGTGHHGTTAGCLTVLEQVVRREKPRNALDLGTGSGVLAIALARLAHIPVLATDIDPVATIVAHENAHLNHVSSLVRTRTAAGFHDPAFKRQGPFDLIVANILARPLMRLAPAMASHLRLGGSLILSGILAGQRNAVVAAYVGQRFRHVDTLEREGWSTLHLKR